MERRLFLAAASPRAREQRRVLTRFVIGCLALTVFALAAVSRTAASAAAGYQVDRLATQVATLTAENRSLRAQAAALSSAPRLAAVAQRSGLVLPTQVVPIPAPKGAATRPSAVIGTPPPPRRPPAVSTPPLVRLAQAVARVVGRLP